MNAIPLRSAIDVYRRFPHLVGRRPPTQAKSGLHSPICFSSSLNPRRPGSWISGRLKKAAHTKSGLHPDLGEISLQIWFRPSGTQLLPVPSGYKNCAIPLSCNRLTGDARFLVCSSKRKDNKMNNRKGIIIAAGSCTRLHPFTIDFSKQQQFLAEDL